MGNSMSCFDRWGKRAPSGALFAPKQKDDGKGGSAVLQGATSPQASTASFSKDVPATPAAAAAKSKSTEGARTMRRRETYSTQTNKGEDAVSSYDDGSDFSESDEENEALSSKDVRQQKLFMFRRQLTKVVKLRSHLFAETVKVTCTKDGSKIEWYKGQTKKEPASKKNPAGFLLVDKITSIKSNADNPKALTIIESNPTPTTYSFTFKSKEEREAWQQQMESFQKFMAMK